MGVVYKGYFFLLLILIPLLAWARIKTKEHTPTETIIGSILGVVITLIVYAVSKQFLFAYGMVKYSILTENNSRQNVRQN